MSDTVSELLRAGRRLEAEGRQDEAIQTYRQAILAEPDDPAVYVHLGELLYAMGFVAQARGIYDIGLRRLPASPILHWVRCMASLPIIPANEAESAAARDDFVERLSGLRAICFASPAATREAARAVGLRSPVLLACLGDVDPAVMALHGRLAADVMAANEPARAVAQRVPWHPGQPIRVGVVCGLFRRHTAWAMPARGWIAHIDRSRFALTGYHTRDERDDETAAASRMFDRFHAGWAPLSVWLDRIAAEAPHVLIYPELGADQTALQLAALPLAPVQCTTWGQPVTSGLPTIGHFLSAAALEPPDAAGGYQERLVRLPGQGTVLDEYALSWGEPLPETDSWAPFDLPDTAVRVLCCQPMQRYQPDHDDVFPRIACAMPEVQFVFVMQDERRRDLLWRRLYLAFRAHDLPAEQHCRFTPAPGPAALSALIRDSHVQFDTIGWSGAETALDAIRHGVPVVTLPARSLRSRHASALLRGAGVADTIVDSVPHLIAQMMRLGQDQAYRRDVSIRLRAGAPRLFGDPAPVRALEAFLTTEVARRCADA
jgi:predicted O-linked N-acetylglucosamine transferase (SPINDLY family)